MHGNKKEFSVSIYNKRLERRSDLQGVKFIATTMNYGKTIEGVVYGPPGTAEVTGYFGDLFMAFRNWLNFTFTLRRITNEEDRMITVNLDETE